MIADLILNQLNKDEIQGFRSKNEKAEKVSKSMDLCIKSSIINKYVDYHIYDYYIS